VRLAVEVPFDELEPSLDAAYKRIGAQVRVPGFRPGKVPRRILEQRIGRPAILDEVVSDAVPKAYDEAIRDNAVRVLGRPEIEVTRIDDGDVVAFTAEVDVRPDMELPAMNSLAVTVEDMTITDEEIDEQLAALRDRFATLTDVERPTEDGDYVSIDLEATVDGELLEDGSATGMSHEVGSGQLIDGLDEAVVGLSAGESATFHTELSAEAAGRTADVVVTVRSVKTKELPELDDEFAQTASEFDTVAELRADTRSRLQRVKAVGQGVQASDHLMEALISAVTAPLPESVIAGEVEWRQHTIVHQLEENGQTLESYLASEERSEEEFLAELRVNAVTAVTRQLILDAYADQEQVGVSEEDLTQHIVMQARRYGIPPEQFAQQLSQGGQLPALMADVRRNKALALLLEAATITDESGRPVDLGLERGGAAGSAVPTETADGQTADAATGAASDEASAVPTDIDR
jgi:trigger factor